MAKLVIDNTIHRDRVIRNTSIISIIANLLLAGGKIVVSIFAHSAAILADGLNNLTDSSSSIITIIGSYLSKKKPTKKHPFGFGRIEYLAALVIGVIVLVTGIETLISGIQTVITPNSEINYSLVTIIVMSASIVVKILLGIFVYFRGKKVDSIALMASGKDAMLDSISTFLALLAGLIFIWSNEKVNLDGWASICVSLLIIKAGVQSIMETLSSILGERGDSEIAATIRGIVKKEPIIISSHDLIINNYGHDRGTGSINVEVDHEWKAQDLYPVFHRLQMEIYDKTHIYLVFGIYPVDNHSLLAKKLKEALEAYRAGHKEVIEYHGLSVDEKERVIYCDAVLDFVKNRTAIAREIENILSEIAPEYQIYLTVDSEFA